MKPSVAALHSTAIRVPGPRGVELLRALGVALFFCLACGARAQEPVILNQQIQFQYDRWQTSGADAVTTSDATYDFTVGAPLISYRLGAFAFTGTLEYARLTMGGQSGSSAGLNRYGVRLSLFPYRRFHLAVDYNFSQSPEFFGAGRVKSSTYGFEYRLRNRRWPSIRLAYRHGDTRLESSREDWSQWSLDGDKVTARTLYGFQLQRQEISDNISGGRWEIDTFSGRADTQFGRSWRLSDYFSAYRYSGSSALDLGASFYGSLGIWTSVSTASVTMQSGDYSKSRSVLVAQSLSRSSGSATIFGSASVVASSGSTEGPSGGSSSANAVALQGGAAWRLSDQWTLLGDLSLLQTSGGGEGLSGPTGMASTLHLGIGRGGDFPGFVRQSLYFLSDLRFDRRISQEYPPGYVPSELADQLLQRRIRQQGTMTFSADLWHTQSPGGYRKDWFRTTGTLFSGERLQINLMGDWRQDRETAGAALQRDEADFSAIASYNMGWATLSGSCGLFKSSERSAASSGGGSFDRNSSYLTLGFRSRWWRIPYGVLVSRYDQGNGEALMTYSAYGSLTYGRLGIRLLCDYGQIGGGRSQTRVSLNLVRSFDSRVLWGGSPWR